MDLMMDVTDDGGTLHTVICWPERLPGDLGVPLRGGEHRAWVAGADQTVHVPHLLGRGRGRGQGGGHQAQHLGIDRNLWFHFMAVGNLFIAIQIYFLQSLTTSGLHPSFVVLFILPAAASEYLNWCGVMLRMLRYITTAMLWSCDVDTHHSEQQQRCGDSRQANSGLHCLAFNHRLFRDPGNTKYNILNSVYPQDFVEQASHFKIIQTASNFPHKENLDFWNCGSVLNVRYKQTYILYIYNLHPCTKEGFILFLNWCHFYTYQLIMYKTKVRKTTEESWCW